MATTTPQNQATLSFPREIFAKLSPHPYLLAHLQPTTPSTPSTRANGRFPTQFRTPHINNSSLTHASGSAVVRIGDTTVVCGVRGEILLASDVPNYRSDKADEARNGSVKERVYNEAKELDLLVPNIELATGCNPLYMPGQAPTTLAQSLSTRLYSLLHSSRVVDGEGLRIWWTRPNLEDEDQDEDGMDESEEREKNEPEIKAWWTLYIDILFISLDGNPFDAAWAAVMSALGDVRLPMAEWDADREMVVCRDEVELAKGLTLRGMPIAVTALVFSAKGATGGKNWLLVDPDTFEEELCDESVTVVVDFEGGEAKMLGIEKMGGIYVGREEVRELVGLAEGRWREFRKLLQR